MKILLRVTSAIVACFAAAAAPLEEAVVGPSLLEFIAANRDRGHAEVRPEVLAFYYTWYGRPERHGQWVHWGGEDAAARDIPESTHYPALGAYDSQDPDVIDTHIAQARSSGVTGFIATWWGRNTFEDRSLAVLLDRTDDTDLRVSVYWETAPGGGTAQIDGAVEDLTYILTRYGSRPSFLRVDGKPVLFIYGRVMGEIPLASWPEIITRARAEAGDFLLIADGYSERNARLFDGVHTYNICAEIQGKSPEALRAWSADHYASAVSTARRRRKISAVTVIPGYDDTKIREPGIRVLRREGWTYRVLWEEAIRARPDWVLITSWNEWHEGSEIEPSWEDGDRYLIITGEYAPRLLAGGPRRVLAADSVLESDERMRRLQALFGSRPIGLLPEFGDAAFWMLDTGLSLRELSWADVTDPAVLHPDQVPLLVQAGGERYASAGRSDGDVVPALQRYLEQGGFLLSIPDQPHPFYYDTADEAPRPVANKIGLPVRMGWERPPEGAQLEFHIDANAMPGLPAKAPFPSAGDLRWRPAVREAVHPEDVYLALATLNDADGRSLGDGIAYVEYRTDLLQGGRTLYVSSRMADAVSRDDLWYAVLRFAGEKMRRSSGGEKGLRAGQDPREVHPTAAVNDLLEGFLKTKTVHIIQDDVLSPVSPREGVIDRSRILDPSLSGNGLDSPRPRENVN